MIGRICHNKRATDTTAVKHIPRIDKQIGLTGSETSMDKQVRMLYPIWTMRIIQMPSLQFNMPHEHRCSIRTDANPVVGQLKYISSSHH
jgi:hypothetical protein